MQTRTSGPNSNSTHVQRRTRLQYLASTGAPPSIKIPVAHGAQTQVDEGYITKRIHDEIFRAKDAKNAKERKEAYDRIKLLTAELKTRTDGSEATTTPTAGIVR